MAVAATGKFKLAKGKSRESKQEKAEKKKIAVFESSLPSMDGMMSISVTSRFKNLLGRLPEDLKKKAEKDDFIRRYEDATGRVYIEKEDDLQKGVIDILEEDDYTDMPPLDMQEDSDEEDREERRGGRKMVVPA